MDAILDGLNPAQREAVTHDTGPLLIVAGAGTGKTTVITRRIAWLIARRRARPEEILALTFTDKAAAEMEERVDTLVPYGYADVTIATFHAFGDRLLRENALEVGLTPDFRVLNRAEQVVFLRDRLFQLPLAHYRPLGDPTRHIHAMISLFSRAKDEDVASEAWVAQAEELLARGVAELDNEELRERAAQQMELAKTYEQYQKLMAEAGAIDFGDQIVYALRLFRTRPYVLGSYQRRFRYILVDEFQDTNYAQFELVKLLASRHGNVAVVADDDQCLPAGTLIDTPSGPRPIESIHAGDPVTTAVGRGGTAGGLVARTFARTRLARLVTFEMESGARLTATDNHKMFCTVPGSRTPAARAYVFLMERQGLGWRIGMSSRLSTRLCRERCADRIVGLRACRSRREAEDLRALWSLKYSIPTLSFARRENAIVDGDPYDEQETRQGAERLAADLGVSLEAHHAAASGTDRAGARPKIILTMCSGHGPRTPDRASLTGRQVLHAVSLATSEPGMVKRLRAAGLPLRKAKKGWRWRTAAVSLREAGARAEFLRNLTDGTLEIRFAAGNSGVGTALLMPAGNVLPGHSLPVLRENRVTYERVVRVSEALQVTRVYDLEVGPTHNFIANGVVVHNSIYKFRGAAISNVLGFMKVYPDARQVVLTDNYRSPQPLLDAAYRLIVHNNPDRLEVTSGISKRLRSVQGHGPAPVHLPFESGTQEADEVARLIQERVAAGTWRHSDVAILVRSNNDADPHLRALNLRNIPWTFSGNAGLYGRPEVRLLIAFLRSVVHPDDSVSVHYLASSDLYQVPIVDLTRCATYADRRHRWLFDVFRQIRALPELAAEIEEEGQRAIRRLVSDLTRYMELAREMPTGELLYLFLADSGWLARMSRAATARDEAEVQNISKFFRRIQDAAKVLRYDNVREFVAHLDALIDAGDDPAVTEADTETPAVRILTVHKAKGLEFPVVFMVGLAQNRFPWPRRREALELPIELVKDVLPAGDFHIQEERRLFYVGMTRARRELYLTSARDYGGTRERKVSQFVLEALDLPKEAANPFRARAIEEIQWNAAPATGPDEWLTAIPPEEELRISHKQVDDYQTCPLKYKYVHVLRVPILRHHSVAYGAIVHKAVEYYLLRRAAGNYTPLADLLDAYERAWGGEAIVKDRSGASAPPAEGFLTREHEEARKAVGRKALTRFWHEEEATGLKPTHVEKEFGFVVGNDKVRGRYDRVDEDLLGAVIIDYKTSDITKQKDADRRAAESLQLKIYAYAWQEATGAAPRQVELRFLESNVAGRHAPTAEDLSEAIAQVKAAALGIRARKFEATPSYSACRYCAYSQICPFTATRS